jgi:hypothetical protein
MKILILITLLSCLNSAFALDIKGFTVDTQLDCQKLANTFLVDSEWTEEVRASLGPEGKLKKCETTRSQISGRISFLNDTAVLSIQRNADNYITQISVYNFDFDQADIALYIKFGSPRFSSPDSPKIKTWVDSSGPGGTIELILSENVANSGKPFILMQGSLGRNIVRDKNRKAAENL